MSPRLALYEPDIPQNAGTIIRTAVCLGVGVDIIEPCGFVWDEKKMRRAGMDYLDGADVVRHGDWEKFRKAREMERLVLLTTKGSEPLEEFSFGYHDVLILGRESSGVPHRVHKAVDARVAIPMADGKRSLNVAAAAAISVAEALRQLGAYPAPNT